MSSSSAAPSIPETRAARTLTVTSSMPGGTQSSRIGGLLKGRAYVGAFALVSDDADCLDAGTVPPGVEGLNRPCHAGAGCIVVGEDGDVPGPAGRRYLRHVAGVDGGPSWNARQHGCGQCRL